MFLILFFHAITCCSQKATIEAVSTQHHKLLQSLFLGILMDPFAEKNASLSEKLAKFVKKAHQRYLLGETSEF